MSPLPSLVARLGAVASVCLCASSAGADTLHWWRFENAPGAFLDSVGSAALTPVGDAHTAALPAVGRGSLFPSGFSFPGGSPNQRSAELDGTDLLTGAVTGVTGDFTVECFAHMDTATGVTAHNFAMLGPGSPTPLTFTLQARLDGLGGTQPRELILGMGVGLASLTLVTSGLVLETGKDYYVAVTVDLSPQVATFYVKNLTDGGPLQFVAKPHPVGALQLTSNLFVGGSPDPGLGFDGLIDEVRISSHVVNRRDLLVNRLPSIPALPHMHD